jgi:ferrous iron transport protein A
MSNQSLAQLPAGARATILAFTDGRAVTNRLASLGFTPGVEVGMAQNFGRGPLIVTVRGTRVALGRGEAEKIFIHQGV